MRPALFVFVTICYAKIFRLIKNTSEIAIFFVGSIGNSLLHFIDRDRYSTFTSINEQRSEISEIDVLKTICTIRDEAVEFGNWTDEHETKLNVLANVLCHEYDWDAEQVERYLHEVISTGPISGDHE